VVSIGDLCLLIRSWPPPSPPPENTPLRKAGFEHRWAAIGHARREQALRPGLYLAEKKVLATLDRRMERPGSPLHPVAVTAPAGGAPSVVADALAFWAKQLG
jgi:hypothetical protein